MRGYLSVLALVCAGCSTLYESYSPPNVPSGTSAAAIVPAGYSAPADEDQLPQPRTLPAAPDVANAPGIGLPELIALSLERNPRLAQVGWAVEAARGRAFQAGLYPNPTLNATGNEISDRTGPGGIWNVYAAQEIVTANKLNLSQAAALKEVDQATLKLITERYRIFTEVRQAFFEAVTLQRRAEILVDLVTLAERSVENAENLQKAKEAARLDVVQLEVDLERYRAELEATRRALPAAYRQLAASVGVQDMPIAKLAGDLDLMLPDYDLERARRYVLSIHPDVRSAQIGVERAQLVLQRAMVEPIPNVMVLAGYTNQGQNRSNDWDVGIGIPVPVWNKNQGNILAAKAQVSEAISHVGRVQNELVHRLAGAFGAYIAARQRAERYRSAILPKAEETLQLSRKAYQGGQFEYLRVLEAQRAVAQANLELVRSLGEMWRAGSEIVGLMLEDQWPSTPAKRHP